MRKATTARRHSPRSAAPDDRIRIERHGDGALVRGVDPLLLALAIMLARSEASRPARRAGASRAGAEGRTRHATDRRGDLAAKVARIRAQRPDLSDSAIARILSASEAEPVGRKLVARLRRAAAR